MNLLHLCFKPTLSCPEVQYQSWILHAFLCCHLAQCETLSVMGAGGTLEEEGLPTLALPCFPQLAPIVYSDGGHAGHPVVLVCSEF